MTDVQPPTPDASGAAMGSRVHTIVPSVMWGAGVGFGGGAAFDGRFGWQFWIGVVLALVGAIWLFRRGELGPRSWR